MDIRGVSFADVKRIVERVSRDTYAGNVIVHHDAYALHDKAFRGRITVKEGKAGKGVAIGARTSASGRRGPYACWHVVRDVLTALFNEYPEARVKTGIAKYEGRDGFLSEYPKTRFRNVGSMAFHVHMPELCECE